MGKRTRKTKGSARPAGADAAAVSAIPLGRVWWRKPAVPEFVAVALLIGFYGFIYFSHIEAYDSLMFDEAGYATMGRTLALEHYYGVDVLGTPESYRPPLFPMMIAASFLLFGVSYTMAKVPVILSALALLATVYVLVRKIWGRRTALFAAAMIGAIPLTLNYVVNVLADVPSALFYTLTMLCLYLGIDKRRGAYFYLAWVCFGLTSLVRYNSVLVLPSLAVFVALELALGTLKSADLIRDRAFLLSPLAALLVGLPYLVYLQVTFGDAFIGVRQTAGALAEEWGRGEWHYYLTHAADLLTEPGCVLVAGGIAWVLYRRDRFGRYLLVWIAVPLVYFSFQPLKDSRLVITIGPPLAMLAAHLACDIWETPLLSRSKASKWLRLLVPAALVVLMFHDGYGEARHRFQSVRAVGYPSLQEAGQWFQEFTAEDAIIMTASQPGHHWYSYRGTVSYPTDIEQFIAVAREADYVVLDDYERKQPSYVPHLFAEAFLTESGALRHASDRDAIVVFGDAALFGNSPVPTTIVVPAQLFVERLQSVR
jgi:hypothetical protein